MIVRGHLQHHLARQAAHEGEDVVGGEGKVMVGGQPRPFEEAARRGRRFLRRVERHPHPAVAVGDDAAAHGAVWIEDVALPLGPEAEDGAVEQKLRQEQIGPQRLREVVDARQTRLGGAAADAAVIGSNIPAKKGLSSRAASSR